MQQSYTKKKKKECAKGHTITKKKNVGIKSLIKHKNNVLRNSHLKFRDIKCSKLSSIYDNSICKELTNMLCIYSHKTKSKLKVFKIQTFSILLAPP